MELQDEAGKAVPGFALDDCTPIVGDFIDHPVIWTAERDRDMWAALQN